MDYRGVLLVAMVSGSVLAAATTACSGPDPGQITFSERQKGTTDLTSGGSNGVITTEAGTSGGGPTDSGKEGGSTSGDPVFGTTAFALGPTGPNAPAKAKDPAHGGDASGKNCMACHTGRWSFAGTLYTDKASMTGVPNAEIRITKADGTEYAKTYSDVDGNFWVSDPQTPIPAGSRVGVRNATLKIDMVGTIAAGQAGCSQAGTCHSGTQGKVYLK